MTRTVLTPRLDDEFSKAGAKTYWKRVLPLQAINYRGRDGRKRVIDFNERYLADLKHSFAEGALDNKPSAPFVLADKDNAHTMDPERYRGEITALVRETELPEDIRAAVIAREGSLPQGLYARTEFPSKKAAKAVTLNPKLPVSMRIREDVERSDGKQFAAVPIHVLGTMDPKIPGLGEWIPADAELSEYAADDVLDLSEESYTEATVPKSKSKNRSGDVQLGTGAATVEVPDIESIDPDNAAEVFAEMDDATLEAFLAQYASGDPETGEDEGDSDESEDDEDDDEPEATLSGNANQDIQLANERAASAERRSREALNRAAMIEWSATRRGLLAEGVPPHVLDLAEPVLARANETVIDLSSFDEDDINVSAVVRELVEGYKGTVDLSGPNGHGGGDTSDPDKAVLERFGAETADL